MPEPAKSIPFFKRKTSAAQEEERKALFDELARTRVALRQAYLGFNSADDPDLIESYVFEINALQSRYSYLLRRAKECERNWNS
jgi:hypothetical protein